MKRSHSGRTPALLPGIQVARRNCKQMLNWASGTPCMLKFGYKAKDQCAPGLHANPMMLRDQHFSVLQPHGRKRRSIVLYNYAQ